MVEITNLTKPCANTRLARESLSELEQRMPHTADTMRNVDYHARQSTSGLNVIGHKQNMFLREAKAHAFSRLRLSRRALRLLLLLLLCSHFFLARSPACIWAISGSASTGCSSGKGLHERGANWFSSKMSLFCVALDELAFCSKLACLLRLLSGTTPRRLSIVSGGGANKVESE